MKLAPVLLLALAACGGSPRPTPEPPAPPRDVTTYYYGTYQVWSPDGTKAYGPVTETVAERMVSPLGLVIVETELAFDRVDRTTLGQTANPDVFDAHDDDDLVTGTVTCTGPTWAWTACDYDLTVDGGKITKHVEITDRGLEIEVRSFLDDATPLAKIVEHLDVVPEAEYLARRDALVTTVTYYAGTATQWNADHTQQVGTSDVLRKRVLRPASHQIEETLVVDGNASFDTYDQNGQANVFTLASEDGLSGTRTLQGPAWAWTSYDDELVGEGATIHIHGEITADGITSTSTIEAGGAVAAILETSYAVISEADFQARFAASFTDP